MTSVQAPVQAETAVPTPGRLQEDGRRQGSLIVVGSGIRGLHQMTIETRARITSADKVFYALSDPVSERWITDHAQLAQNLLVFYGEGKNRLETYDEMIEAIMKDVRAGLRVCAVFYGHPGVFVDPSHECIRIAREEGYRAVMLPGISAEGCLYADLGVDPGENGFLSYEATELILGDHKLDPTCSVILWQVDSVGDSSYHRHGYDGRYVPLLVEALLKFYPPEHTAILYRAPALAVARAKIVPTTIGGLADDLRANPGVSTLYIPPAAPPRFSRTMAERLGMDTDLYEVSEGAGPDVAGRN